MSCFCACLWWCACGGTGDGGANIHHLSPRNIRYIFPNRKGPASRFNTNLSKLMEKHCTDLSKVIFVRCLPLFFLLACFFYWRTLHLLSFFFPKVINLPKLSSSHTYRKGAGQHLACDTGTHASMSATCRRGDWTQVSTFPQSICFLYLSHPFIFLWSRRCRWEVRRQHSKPGIGGGKQREEPTRDLIPVEALVKISVQDFSPRFFPGCQRSLELCLAAVVNHAVKLESPGFTSFRSCPPFSHHLPLVTLHYPFLSPLSSPGFVGRGRLAELPLFNNRAPLARSSPFFSCPSITCLCLHSSHSYSCSCSCSRACTPAYRSRWRWIRPTGWSSRRGFRWPSRM